MEEQKAEKNVGVWNKLSKDGQALAISLAVGGGLTQGREYLEAMAQYPDGEFDLERGMQDLTSVGALE